MFVQTEFEDEIELASGNKFIPVIIQVNGDVDESDQTVENINFKKTYSAKTGKRVNFRAVALSEVQRLTEKAKEKLLITYKENSDDMVSSSYDDGHYYDSVHDDEKEEVRKLRYE